MVDEHQSFVKICPCGHTNTAKFPENVTGPVGYGPHIKSTAVYLSVQQMIPEDRLKQTFEDVFKLPISTATLTKISSRFAEKAEPIQEKVLVTLKKAKRKNADESGFRIGGKTNWLQNLSNKTHTYYKPTEKRGDVFKEGLSGILVHDHFKPYNMIKTVQHAFCNAHHLRELKALRDIEKEEWASKMYQLLCGANRCENPSKARVIKTYDRILKEGFHFHEAQMPLSKRKNKRRVGHNLLIRLRDHKEGTLRFLTDRQCPFTNNQAEQDIRMMKVKQKISGGFRTMKGAKIFCTIRGFLSTSRKQGCNIFGAIHLMHSPCR